MSRVLILTTGGTIGALPVERIDRMPHFKTMPPEGDVVAEALKVDFKEWDTRCVSLEPRDSNFIDAPYRENLARLIEESEEQRVILTHGTDTILDTAAFFYERRKGHPSYTGKPIILTGAMVPLANGTFSDGYQNIAFSLQQLCSLSVPPPPLSLVLCGYERLAVFEGAWAPRLYPFKPNLYQRYYDAKDPLKDGLAPYGYPEGREPILRENL